jgi:hypothetical protein
MWHSGIRVNRIDMVVLSTRYNLLHGHSFGWNREDKRAGGGVVWGWVTDREVWPRLKFNQRSSVISVKNILIERLVSRIIQRFKKIEEKNLNFFWKKYKLCRRGYVEGKAVGIDNAEGSSYADGQIELRRETSTPRGYAEGSPRRRLRWRQLAYAEGYWPSAYLEIQTVDLF